MLGRIEAVVGAFETGNDSGDFEVWSLETGDFSRAMRPSRSGSNNRDHRVGIVQRSTFVRHGQNLRTININ